MSSGGPGGYTPGYTDLADRLMRRRRLESHAPALRPHLRPGRTVLDCGCGAGSITADLARVTGPGTVVGVDRSEEQLARARERTPEGAVRYVRADAAALPFPDDAFDVAFGHALLEHVPDPGRVLAEIARVVAPGGVVVVASPDFSGLMLCPPDEGAAEAVARYADIQRGNGGNLHLGGRLGDLALAVGLLEVSVDARYEVYEDSRLIADYLAERLEASPQLDVGRDWRLEPEEAARHSGALSAWARRPASAFCQAWVTATGRVPPAAGTYPRVAVESADSHP